MAYGFRNVTGRILLTLGLVVSLSTPAGFDVKKITCLLSPGELVHADCWSGNGVYVIVRNPKGQFCTVCIADEEAMKVMLDHKDFEGSLIGPMSHYEYIERVVLYESEKEKRSEFPCPRKKVAIYCLQGKVEIEFGPI